MKRASYREALQWIAENDSPADAPFDDETIARYISVQLVSDLFGVEALRVAGAVVRYRRKHYSRIYGALRASLQDAESHDAG